MTPIEYIIVFILLIILIIEIFKVDDTNTKLMGGIIFMTQLTTDQKVGLAISFVDKYGNATRADNIVWSSSNPDIIVVSPSPDGFSASVETVGLAGNAQVVVTADADLGDGVREITGAEDFVVVAGEAAAVSFVVGLPEPK